MIIRNTGNVLPFYDLTRWQRHRLTGQNILPFGIIAPNVRALPFQFYVATGPIPEGITWQFVNAADESDVINMSSALLEIQEATSGAFWVTWKAAVSLDTVPPCGYWYIILGIGETNYYSEVMNLKPSQGFDTPALIITSCDNAGDILTVSFEQNDTVAAPPVTEVIEALTNESTPTWVNLGTDTGTVMTEEFPPNSFQVRRTITTINGNTITATYEYTFGDISTGCDGEFTLLSVIDSGPSSAKPLWRFKFSNTSDKGNVLYQFDYVQHFYIAEPVFNNPLVDRTTERILNGFGTEVSRYTRTVERMRFEAEDIPDYMIDFLASAGDLDTIVLEEVTSGDNFALTNLDFTSRRQGIGLNIGQFEADNRTEVFSGCQEEFVIA